MTSCMLNLEFLVCRTKNVSISHLIDQLIFVLKLDHTHGMNSQYIEPNLSWKGGWFSFFPFGGLATEFGSVISVY